MTDSANEYFDDVDISFYGLLDPVTRLEGLDIEIEIDAHQFASVSAIVDEIREAMADGGVHDCIIIERRRTEFEWGASGVGEAIIVGIATAYLADAIKAVVARFITRSGAAIVMGEAEAEQHVRQRLAVRYDLDASKLELVSVATTAESVEVTLAHPDGAPVYRATVIGSGIGARATRLERVEQPQRAI